MRRRRRARRWQRSAVIFLSILFLLTCAVGAVLRRDDAAEQVSVELWQKAEQRIYWNALCAVSPMIGFLWEQEAAGGYMTAEDVETLLLAEQSAQVSGWPDISSEDSGEGLLQEMELQETIAGEDVVLFFPEDCDELPAPITEQDADLLAEIDRENERQRELAAIAGTGTGAGQAGSSRGSLRTDLSAALFDGAVGQSGFFDSQLLSGQ